jgi:hypothetical protein
VFVLCPDKRSRGKSRLKDIGSLRKSITPLSKASFLRSYQCTHLEPAPLTRQLSLFVSRSFLVRISLVSTIGSRQSTPFSQVFHKVSPLRACVCSSFLDVRPHPHSATHFDVFGKQKEALIMTGGSLPPGSRPPGAMAAAPAGTQSGPTGR